MVFGYHHFRNPPACTFLEIDMLFQSMDVLILQGRGGGARRRSPSPRSLTLGVYEFIVSRNFNLWLQVESLLNISIFFINFQFALFWMG